MSTEAFATSEDLPVRVGGDRIGVDLADHALVESAQAGSAEAFGELARRYHGNVYGIVSPRRYSCGRSRLCASSSSRATRASEPGSTGSR